MRKLAIAAALIASTMSAEAGQRNHNHQHYPHHHQHQQYRHNNNGAVFGGIVGGLILGGMLMNQPQYYYQQPMCRNVFVGNFWNGYQWVRQFQVMCN